MLLGKHLKQFMWNSSLVSGQLWSPCCKERIFVFVSIQVNSSMYHLIIGVHDTIKYCKYSARFVAWMEFIIRRRHWLQGTRRIIRTNIWFSSTSLFHSAQPGSPGTRPQSEITDSRNHIYFCGLKDPTYSISDRWNYCELVITARLFQNPTASFCEIVRQP